MRRFILYIALALTTASTLPAQNMSDILKTMPDSIMPLLTKNDRLDFIDYLASNMKAEVTNRLGGKSEMTAISPDYTHISMTGSSETTLKLLPLTAGDTIICMIQTYIASGSDSKITFYTKEWTKLPTERYFNRPSTDKFIVSPDSLTHTERTNLLNKVDVPIVKAEASANNHLLKLTLTSPTLMSKDDRKKIEPYLRSTITLNWNGERFQ